MPVPSKSARLVVKGEGVAAEFVAVCGPKSSGVPGVRMVVGTTRDPATPYRSAQALARDLKSGVLLGWVGDGHTAYMMGSSCIDSAVDKYLTEVSEDPELRSRNLEPLRRKLLQAARDDYERFVAEHPDDPELLADLGRAHGRLGEIVAILDSQPRAIEHFDRAREIFERLRQQHPDEAAYQGELARTLPRLGTAHNAAGES